MGQLHGLLDWPAASKFGFSVALTLQQPQPISVTHLDSPRATHWNMWFSASHITTHSSICINAPQIPLDPSGSPHHSRNGFRASPGRPSASSSGRCSRQIASQVLQWLRTRQLDAIMCLYLSLATRLSLGGRFSDLIYVQLVVQLP